MAGWNARIDRWLAEDVPGWQPYQDWQPGRTVLATTNDRTLQVFNGDLGVVIATDDAPAWPPTTSRAASSPSRL